MSRNTIGFRCLGYKAGIPVEPFKRAVATTVRSIAGEPELEVAFSTEPSQLRGLKARLTSPSRTLPAHEVALVRGQGDAFALRKAYHQDKIHDRFRPASPEGAAVFEAAEQARVEAIGSLAMKGVAANLAAGLEQRMLGRGMSRAQSREEAPLPEVMGLLVREALTGEKPPAAAARSGRFLAALHRRARRQGPFQAAGPAARPGRLCPPHPHHPARPGAGRRNRQRPEQRGRRFRKRRRGKRTGRRAGGQRAGRKRLQRIRAIRRRGRPGSGRRYPHRAAGRHVRCHRAGGEGAKPHRQEAPPFAHQADWGYKVFTTQHDEEIAAADLCGSEELARLRGFLDQQLASSV